MLPILVTTKLHRPIPRAGHVARVRLLNRLDEALQPGRRLTVVACPAGYGKTALLGEWYGRMQAIIPAPALAWASLDEGEDDAVRFWSLVIAALQSACALPDLGAEALGLLKAPGPAALEAVVALVLNDLAALSTPVVLALDDYHLIQSPAVHGSLAQFIERLPPAARVVIATRAEPPLGLARLRVGGQLVELGLEDLRFTSGEAYDFLHGWLGDLPAADAAQLAARTEGWAAGLQLAALALQSTPLTEERSALIARFAGSQWAIVDYLVEEVLQRQTSEAHDFLLRTSILHRLSASACAALLDPPADITHAAALLEGLERANLFLIPLNADRSWFRYHHLFAEALRARLDAVDPRQAIRLHQRAAQWFEGAGFPDLAIQHALTGQDHDQAARLIRAQARPLMIRGELATWLNWVGALPKAVRAAQPWLLGEHAMALLFSGRLDEAETLAAQALAGAADLPDCDHLAGVIAALRAYAADARGAFAEALAQADRADALLPADDYLSRGILPFVRGRAHLASGDLRAAEQAFGEMIAVARRAGNIWTLSIATSQAAYVSQLRGDLRSAAALFNDALVLADARGERGYAPAAVLETGLAAVQYERNALSEAQALLDGALGRLRGWGNPASLATALLTHSRVALALGRAKDADQALTEAEQLMRRTAVAPVARGAIAAERARQWLAAGQYSQATRWADDHPEVGWHSSVAGDLVANAVARIRLAQGQAAEAGALLAAVVERAEAGGRTCLLVDALTLQSLVLATLRRPSASLDALARATRLALPEGRVRIFLEEGEPLLGLLQTLHAQAARRDGGLADRLATLLAAFPGVEVKPAPASRTPRDPSGLIEPLSARELDVLRLVQEGHSNREIAERLVVSLATVKKHIEHAHAKLGVHSRTQALARAQELGLL